MKLGRIRPAPRKPAPKKLAPVKPALKKPTPVRPTPSPGLPRSPDRGNVEQNYRGIPGLVNATAPIPRSVRPTPSPGLPPAPAKPAPRKPALKKPTPAKPAPVNPGLVSKEDPFFKSKEFKDFTKDQAGRPATMDMYKSPYFGDVGSGSFGRAQDEAYRKFKNIPDPTPRMISPGPTPPSGGAPTMGGTFANQLLGRSAPSGGATGNPTGVKLPPGGLARPVFQGMKKGGEVKASKATKASSASKRGDGIATKGKTKGRFV